MSEHEAKAAPILQPILQKQDIYLARAEAGQASLQRSLLVLVALVAFWLAIENGYGQFVEYRAADARFAASRLWVAKQRRQRDIEIAERVRATSAEVASGNAAAPVAGDERSLLQVQARVRQAEENSSKLKDERDKIVREPIILKVAGTDLPSRLSYAPILWLVVLLCWLAFFDAKRAATHRNLAAAFSAREPDKPMFGVAGDGSAWIAPLPAKVSLAGSDGQPFETRRADLLTLLGWTHKTESRYRLYLAVLALVVFGLALRICFIIADLLLGPKHGILSHDQLFGLWPVVAILLAGGCCAMLARFALTPISAADAPAFGRRDAVAGLIGAALVVGGAFCGKAIAQAGRRILHADPSDATQIRGHAAAPRFVSSARKKAKAANRATAIIARNAAGRPLAPGTLFRSARSPRERDKAHPLYTLRTVGANGKARLFVRPTRVNRAIPLSPDDLLGSLNAPSGSGIAFNPLNTVAIEQSALACLEQRGVAGIDDACKLLLGGARLTLEIGGAHRPNWRLIDLLAGLAVRHGREEQFLVPLVRVAQTRLDAENGLSPARQAAGQTASPGPNQGDGQTRTRTSAAAARLAALVQKWAVPGSAWRKRWSDRSRPCEWGHPLDPESKSSLANSRFRHRTVNIV